MSLEAGTMGAAQRRRHDDVDHGLADDRFALVPEGPLRGGIELDEAALLIDGDDAIQRAFQDAALQKLAVAERGLRGLSGW